MTEWNEIKKMIQEDSEKMKMSFKEEYWDEMETILEEKESVISLFPFSSSNSFNGDLFEDEYWDEMCLILDKEDRRKRRNFFMRWVGDVAGILILAFFLIKSVYSPETNEAEYKLAELTSTNKKLDGLGPEEYESTTPKNKKTYLQENSPLRSVQFTDIEPSINGMASSTMKVAMHPTKSTALVEELHSDPTVDGNVVSLPIDCELRPVRGVSEEIVKKNPQNNILNNPIRHKNIISPLSLRMVVASNMIILPSGNVSDGSRLGVSHTAGIEAVKHKVNWSYSLGVNMTHRKGMNHEMLLVKSTYGTRLYREIQSVKYKSIGSVGLPVGINYHKGRNLFGIKAIPTWNLIVNSTYHRYNNFNQDELYVSNNFGIKEGISPFDLKLQLTYERSISERFSIGVNVLTGILNQIDEEFIVNSTGLYEYSVGFNVGYTLKRF